MPMDASVEPGIYHGVYTYREAAMLLRVTRQRVQRWADGYTYVVKYGVRRARAVLQSREHARGVLSFPELFELFFVKEFVALGVPLTQVRRAAENLSRRVGDFPFTRNKLFAMGRQIVASIGEALVEPASGQTVLKHEDVGHLIADFAAQIWEQVLFDADVVVRY